MQQKKRKYSDEERYAASRQIDADLGGKGVEIIVGKRGEQGAHYFTSKLPPLVIHTHNVRREIRVEASSIEQDNARLLHHLFSKTAAA